MSGDPVGIEIVRGVRLARGSKGLRFRHLEIDTESEDDDVPPDSVTESSEESDEDTPSTLCEHCSVVSFEGDLGTAVEEAWSVPDSELELQFPTWDHHQDARDPDSVPSAQRRRYILRTIGEEPMFPWPQRYHMISAGHQAPSAPSLGHQRTDIGPHFPGLRQSAEKGCGLCLTILEFLLGDSTGESGDTFEPNYTEPKPTSINIWYTGYKVGLTSTPLWQIHPDRRLRFMYNNTARQLLMTFEQPESKRMWTHQFNVGAALNSRVRQHLQLHSLHPPVTLTANYASRIIAYWLDCCDKTPNHQECRANGTYTPTRLVFLGNGPVPEPQLVENPDEGTKYVALSYVWGDPRRSKPPPKTFRNNLDQHKIQITWDGLPLCFRDVMRVCIALEIRYVWIDSLCIVQDDNEDWEREAAKIADVYANAVVTFAATKGKSVNTGLCHRGPRQSRRVCSIPFRSRIDPSIQGSVCILRDTSTARIHSDLILLERSYWASRGWTFQENEVSRRIVYFRPNGLAFECRRWHATEDNRHLPLGYEDGVLRILSELAALNQTDDSADLALPDQTEDSSRPNGPFVIAVFDEDDIRDVYTFWRRVCVTYATAGLTFPEKDRLLALSAVARIFQDYVPNAKYVAGLWSENLHLGLLWEASVDVPKDTNVSVRYMAPSWSWASTLADISWVRIQHTPIQQFNIRFGFDMRLKSKNDYGALLEGSALKVETDTAYLISSIIPRRYGETGATFGIQSDDGEDVGIGTFDSNNEADWDGDGNPMMALPLVNVDGSYMNVTSSRLGGPVCRVCFSMDEDIPADQPPVPPDTHPATHVCVLLKRLPGKGTGVFHRVGLAFLFEAYIPNSMSHSLTCTIV